MGITAKDVEDIKRQGKVENAKNHYTKLYKGINFTYNIIVKNLNDSKQPNN